MVPGAAARTAARRPWSTRRVWRAAGVPDHLGRALVEYGWLLNPPSSADEVVPLRVAAVLAGMPDFPGEQRPRAFRRPGLRDQKALRLAEGAAKRADLPVTATLLVWEDDAALALTAQQVGDLVSAADRLAGTQVLLPVGAWVAQVRRGGDG